MNEKFNKIVSNLFHFKDNFIHYLIKKSELN
jgi:hypothetical protein